MRRCRLLAGLAIALLAFAAPSAAASPRTEITDVEDEVMCPICGTLLELSDSPQAQRERVFISRLIARGETKAQIKDELVAQYGPRVLALPRGSGFSLSAYLVPAIGFLVAALALIAAALRWRRSGDGAGSPTQGAGPQDEDEKLLDADMARYDL